MSVQRFWWTAGLLRSSRVSPLGFRWPVCTLRLCLLTLPLARPGVPWAWVSFSNAGRIVEQKMECRIWGTTLCGYFFKGVGWQGLRQGLTYCLWYHHVSRKAGIVVVQEMECRLWDASYYCWVCFQGSWQSKLFIFKTNESVTLSIVNHPILICSHCTYYFLRWHSYFLYFGIIYRLPLHQPCPYELHLTHSMFSNSIK